MLPMIAEGEDRGLTRVPIISGRGAVRYFLTVFLLMPYSLAMRRMPIPLLLALWIAFHQAL